ncbi:Protein CTR9 [Ancistrocladus abbreviatus]
MGCVYIPVQHSEEEVRVALDQLPRDASDILDILKAEQAPLDIWLIIAREYFKQGKIEQFRQILEEGSSPEIDEYYAEVRYERVAILNALGAYYSYLGKIETKQKEKEEHFMQATTFYNRASRIDMHEPSTWVGKGQLLLAKGEVEQAFAAFKIVLDGDHDNVPALLGQACVQFNRGRYSESLDLYKRALRAYPDCPGAVRLGIGFCRYKLGQFEKARQAFERVLQLDPENVEALVALGILDLQTNDADGIRRGMQRMQHAFEIYPYHPTSLNYLANHFFFTGQHFLVEQLTETALAVTNHGLTKAHSYYNLARSYHSKGDCEKAGRYYMASVKESSKPQEFVLPYYGLGQVQLKLGDFRSALSNFEKVLEVYPENCETLKALGHIYVQLKQIDKAMEVLRKVTKIDPRDAQAFLDLGELLISSDIGAALDAFRTGHGLLRKRGEDVPIELLNNIGLLHFERGEYELAEQTFKDGLGDGIWLVLIDGKKSNYTIDSWVAMHQYEDVQIFHPLQKEGFSLEVPWNKVPILFNLGRLFEELHRTESAIMLYLLILHKYPDYVDAFLRLAAIAKARNNIPLSIQLVGEALKVKEKCSNALSMLGVLELKNDEWVKAKGTFLAAGEAANGDDSYAALCLGNWNYFAALRNEKRNAKLEATHLEKAKDLYKNVLKQRTANLYAANGVGLYLAEKGQFDGAKDIFSQVLEASSGNVFAQMPDVWINLAHVYFAQGNFTLAVKMYQNCLRKFYYNTESQVLIYLARTHYEAEQWQDCKKTLLRAIHLVPSNYTLRFNVGVVMQKFSASTLNKTKRTVDEVHLTVSELENAIRVFSQLSASSHLNFHGFDEKKIDTHVRYCKHIYETAKVHYEAAEHEEQQNRQRLELARQVAIAEDARRKAEEQRKLQLERRKQEEELKRVRQLEEHFQRVKEQWKSSSGASKRKDRTQSEDEEGDHGVKKRRKGGKRRRKDKSSRSRYETEEAEAERAEDEEEMEDEEPNDNYRELSNEMNERDDGEDNPLAAAGLEDSDVDDNGDAPSTTGRRKRGWSESEDEEPADRLPESSHHGENSAELQESGDAREDGDKLSGVADEED